MSSPDTSIGNGQDIAGGYTDFGANKLLTPNDIVQLDWRVKEEIAAYQEIYPAVGWGEPVFIQSPEGTIAAFPPANRNKTILQVGIISTT